MELATQFCNTVDWGVDRSSIDLVLAERREAATDGDEGHGEDGRPGSADRAAAERLLGRHRRALERVADPRQRRQRAYALLARNGFDPEICREVAASAALSSGPESPESPDLGD